MIGPNKELIFNEFVQKLVNDEKSEATIDKYVRDVKFFFEHVNCDREIKKEDVICYKKYLISRYAPASVNSMLASLNCFLKFMGWQACMVKSIKIQRDAFRAKEKELTKEEYYKLLSAAKKKSNERLYLLMQTICSTGIRISELKYITVEAVHARRAVISMKGKVRTIMIPIKLCSQLKRYIHKHDIKKGPIFITRNGNPVDRSNIRHEMKKLSALTGVAPEKIFPHNLRHLFACVFYQLEKDVCRLADILGHSNVNTTRIYTMISVEQQEKQINSMKLVFG